MRASGYVFNQADLLAVLAYYNPNDSITDNKIQPDQVQAIEDNKNQKTLTGAEAKELIITLLRERKNVGSSTEFVELFRKRNITINQTSLKAYLRDLKKANIILNKKPKGDWVLIKNDDFEHGKEEGKEGTAF